MKKLLIIAALFLSACSSQLGNFSHASTSELNAMAQDVSDYLNQAYSPAKTQFSFENKISESDYFGLTLQENLRQKGFAVKLSQKTEKSNLENAETDPRLLNIPVKYVVDGLDDNNYRVTLYFPDSVISRAYATNRGRFTSLGAWVRGN